MKIGIGITSYNRPEHLELCLRQVEKHTKGDKLLFVAKDIPNIAKAKNQCLYALRDCDHIFLFDDDCFPIKDGWVEFFTSSKYDYLLYLTERHHWTGNGDMYRDCGGCFISMSKGAFNKVGYFNTEYKQYGFEHCGHAKRWNKFGYFSEYKTKNYLYSLDYQGEGDWGVKHKPSITDYKAMQESIDYNRKVFEKEITGDKIYYDYKP